MKKNRGCCEEGHNLRRRDGCTLPMILDGELAMMSTVAFALVTLALALPGLAPLALAYMAEATRKETAENFDKRSAPAPATT
jgi:hypothetical protein